jgi:hypothetical protein
MGKKEERWVSMREKMRKGEGKTERREIGRRGKYSRIWERNGEDGRRRGK